MPDGIANVNYNGTPYFFTANEGDAREYTGFSESKRIKDITLDATAFPNGAILKQDAQLGRLNITTTLGDTDGEYRTHHNHPPGCQRRYGQRQQPGSEQCAVVTQERHDGTTAQLEHGSFSRQRSNAGQRD